MSRRFASLLGAFLLMTIMAGPLLAQEKPPVTAHDVAGKENCLMCHAPDIMPPAPDVPADHEGRGIESCQWCHASDSAMQTTGATPTTHDLAGKDNCMMCHAVGVMPPVPDVPASHESRGNETCTWCHVTVGIE